jgi:hypothetical protein
MAVGIKAASEAATNVQQLHRVTQGLACNSREGLISTVQPGSKLPIVHCILTSWVHTGMSCTATAGATAVYQSC